MPAPTYSYGFGSNPVIDYPRLIVADTDMTKPIFADEEIEAMYQIEQITAYIPVGQGATLAIQANADVRRVAAGLLDSLSHNKARLAAALKVLDIQLDSTKAAAELRASAKALRETVANSGHFAITEMVNTQEAARERVWKQLLRIQGG